MYKHRVSYFFVQVRSGPLLAIIRSTRGAARAWRHLLRSGYARHAVLPTFAAFMLDCSLRNHTNPAVTVATPVPAAERWPSPRCTCSTLRDVVTILSLSCAGASWDPLAQARDSLVCVQTPMAAIADTRHVYLA